jgi:hypothetical protein
MGSTKMKFLNSLEAKRAQIEEVKNQTDMLNEKSGLMKPPKIKYGVIYPKKKNRLADFKQNGIKFPMLKKILKMPSP